MREILIFGGTTEGRQLSEILADAEIFHTLCVATEYGELVLSENPFLRIHRGRMDEEQMKEFIENGEFEAVVDATHPYADIVTRNIRTAMKEMQIPYFRLKRELKDLKQEEKVYFFDTAEECAEALKKTGGNILLTTGSKELAKYCACEEVKNRLFVRILPGAESLSLCLQQGIAGKQIIAMQGPFTTEMNEALIHQFGISCMVTKQSGGNGGWTEKAYAAKKTGIPLFVVGNPGKEDGSSFEEVRAGLEKICQKEIRMKTGAEITLAGTGMGNPETLTGEVRRKIEGADILLGAERMIAPYQPRIEKKPLYSAKEIVPYLQSLQKKYPAEELKTVVLFSGDSGFYSGAQALYQALRRETEEGRLRARIQILPGISSVAFLAACIGESYQDARILSMHGKELCNIADRIKHEKKTFLLMSGVKDVNRLGDALLKAGMNGCEIVTGYRLSYPQQQIEKRTPLECTELKDEGLYTCFVNNPDAVPGKLTPGVREEEFIRDRVPMTKEEVREVSICKLGLHRGAVVFDIGSGTGSVAMEMAGLSPDIQVYAIERKKEAVSLILQNKEKFSLDNVTVMESEATEAIKSLPKPTHAFIGGSSGNLKKILKLLYEMNPELRVVMNAISMETICEIKEIPDAYPVENQELVQMQVSRSQTAGSYHLMKAENPVWIYAFDFKGQRGEK